MIGVPKSFRAQRRWAACIGGRVSNDMTQNPAPVCFGAGLLSRPM